MKLATLRVGDRTVAARLDGDSYTEITGFTDVGTLLAHPTWRVLAAAAAGPRHPAGNALDAVVPNPGKVLCVGLNYTGHILEMGRPLPEYPTLFAKFADTLTGPADPVVAVAEDPELDWEGELVVVIGRTAHRVTEAEAADCIAGYTVANDISMRGYQNRTNEWLQGKMWARSTPVGPVMVTADEFDPATAILRTEVNGTTMQHAKIGDLLFGPTQLIAYISTIVPLRPGDLVLTGTPDGVGKGRNPQIYLAAGDRVTVSIDGIGEVSTPIVAPA